MVAPVVTVKDMFEGSGRDSLAVVGECEADVVIVRIDAGDGDVDLRTGVF